MLFLRAAEKRRREPDGYYEQICGNSNGICRKMSTESLDIRKDVARTGTGRTFVATAAGKASLDRVLRAYATRNTVLGFGQGMSYVAEELMKVIAKEEEVRPSTVVS